MQDHTAYVRMYFSPYDEGNTVPISTLDLYSLM